MLGLVVGIAVTGCEGSLQAVPDAAAPPDAGPAGDMTPAACTAPPQGTFSRKFQLADWLAQNPGRRPVRRTTQSGQADPAPFVGAAWEQEVAEFGAAWREFIGPLPESCVPLDARDEELGLSPEERAGIHADRYSMKRVSYRGAHGERIPAFLLVPRGAGPGDPSPRPGVLVMHQSLSVCGKKEPAGVCLQGTAWLAFARDLAEQGLVTLAPDSVGYGERAQYSLDTGSEYADAAPLLGRFPQATLMGLRIADVRRGIDYLQSLPVVDPRRIGMIGHSNGGIETLFSAAFDDRIRCAMSNAGPNLVRRETVGMLGLPPGIARWAGFGYLPAMGFFKDRVPDLPVEIHQLYALVAPRGLFVSLIEDDTVAPTFDRIDWWMAQAARAFAALGGDFASHKVASGLTPQCLDEWGVPLCVAQGYQACQGGGDRACLDRYAAAGVTAACIGDWSGPAECAHNLYWAGCRKQGKSDAQCRAAFQAAGIELTDACVQQGYESGCRRDHGWYPETQALAYPWLAACLAR